MTYATQQDLITRFGEAEIIQRSDRIGAGVVDEAVVERALLDATEQINAHLAARYTLPLPGTTTFLQRLCCDLARYHLAADGASEAVRKRYEDALATLRQAAKGEVEIAGATETVAASSTGTGNAAYFHAKARVFGGGEL